MSLYKGETPIAGIPAGLIEDVDKKAYKSYVDNDKLNIRQITNCITEIPQRIKLELNDGVLTLKAGSKVIVPNGFEVDGVTPKFDEVEIESDVSTTQTSNVVCTVYYGVDTNALYAFNEAQDGSGSTVPSTGYADFYNTSTNKINRYNNGVQTTQSDFTFPIAKVTVTNGAITSLDQIFNGIGYIGSTVWVDKGVKGLIPDGRNDDGTLKNIGWTNDKVRIATGTATGNFFIGYSFDNNTFGEYKAENWVFDINENKYIHITTGLKYSLINFGDLVLTSGAISNFQPKQAISINNICDGQWVGKILTVARSIVCSSTDVTYDLSSYLPNDNKNYEVMFSGYAQTTGVSGKFADLTIKSSIISDVNMVLARTRMASAMDAQGVAIVPIGIDRNITIQGSTSENLAGNHTLIAIGYRRLGTNV